MKLTGIYVNAKDHTATPATIENKLQAYYDLLDVSTIDIVSRNIGGEYYDIICDDEALLKEKPVLSMIDTGCNPMLFGNLFIVKHDGEGNEISLKQADIKRILGNYKTLFTTKGFMNFMVGGY